jgi:hypothetical protein
VSGLGRWAWRAGYEVWNRSGAARMAEPAPAPWPDTAGAPDHAGWLAMLANSPHGRWWSATRRAIADGSMRAALEEVLDEGARDAVIRRAEAANSGQIRGFGHLEMQLGWPIDWHRAPRAGQRWSAEIHHTQALQEMTRCGDVKWTWEIGRSPHVFDWVRAATLDPAGAHDRLLGDYLVGFVAQCAWRRGVHWASGQEVALRVMAWMWAAALGVLDDAGWDALVKVMLASGHHLARHIGFARRAVPNNHLMAESLALWMLGLMCPWAPDAASWAASGRCTFLHTLRTQHLNDGGYCQSSHTYHRLALHLTLWAFLLFEDDAELAQAARAVCVGATDYLAAFMDHATGQVSAWGALDGALLNPWTECAYGDMRPVLGAMRRAVGGGAAFEAGLWDEESLWFMGPGLDRAPAPLWAGSSRWPASGLLVRRLDVRTFGVLRAGPQRLPFGQADQGHVSLWWSGREVVCDGGSYCYNDALEVHELLHGPAGHNAPRVVGGDGGYRRIGRWSWWRAPAARGVWRGMEMVATWEADGVSWERVVSAEPDGWRVVDRASGVAGRAVVTRWLLDGAGWRVDERGARDEAGARIEVRGGQVRIEPAVRSRRYLELEAASALIVESAGETIEVVTRLVCGGQR